jgi:hypothetical protein
MIGAAHTSGCGDRASARATWTPALARLTLVLPELYKPSFCRRRVPCGRLQIAMPEIVRQRSGVVSIIGELVAARMAKLVVVRPVRASCSALAGRFISQSFYQITRSI